MQDNVLLNVHAFEEGKFNTASGKLISIHDPKPEDICIEDIASSLAKICRFGGNIPSFYSVAQHSVMVALLAPFELSKAALLHDAAEAYLGDVISPLKHILKPIYEPLEQRFLKVIFEKFDVPIEQYEMIKRYDIMALESEYEYFRGIDMHRLNYFWKFHLPTIWTGLCLQPTDAYTLFDFHYHNIFKP